MEESRAPERLVGMQPLRIPPHLAAVAVAAMLFLFLAGLVAANAATQKTGHVAPGTFLVHAR
jgi:hypothetical protein